MSEELSDRLRASGERLATADNALRVAYNNKQPLDSQIDEFLDAAASHVEDLRAGKAASDALMCAVGALLTTDVYGYYNKLAAINKLVLYDAAIRSAIDHFETLEDDGTDMDHRGYILSYLASLLYYNYTLALKEDSSNPVLSRVYPFLNAIKSSGAIQSPKIMLGETEVDPATPGALLIDVMGRAAATSR